LSMAAEQGDAEAQFALGGMYDDGVGVRHDMLVATEWYRKAAVQGHVDAQYRLGLVCQYGHHRFLDTIEACVVQRCLYVTGCEIKAGVVGAVAWYTKAAAQGHSDAARMLSNMRHDAYEGDFVEVYFELGRRYYMGKGAPADRHVGLMWLRLAAAGDPGCDNSRTWIHYDDFCLCVNARTWIRADEGDAHACFDLGLALEDYDAAYALSWIHRAVDMGDISAQSHMLDMYEDIDEENDTKNLALAAQMLCLIASHDHTYQKLGASDLREMCKARCRLGQMSLTGAEEWGIAKDRAAAVEWYQKAIETAALCDSISTYHYDYEANWGNEALYRLGRISDDEGGYTDLWCSAEHYRAAAEKGHMLAQRKLGFLFYHRGDGSQSHRELAFRWISESLSDKHHRQNYTYTHLDVEEAEAQLLLGHMYLHGEGTDVNLFSAAFRFRLGGDNNTARHIYDTIEAHGSAQDLYYLGWHVYHPYPALENAAVAADSLGGMVLCKTALEKAAEKGHAEAMDCLGMMHCNGSLPVDLDVAE
ncbi:MAG: sel1 repeat family protein, partial [Oxalobacteraceae bacterium]|nr:sel1 repeat family protein [Oxalobacteraceae bacterium]